MAAFKLFVTLLFLLAVVSLSSPSAADTCKSQTFTNNDNHYASCTNLPTLNSQLHWTYNPSQSTLSIAFIAPPARPDGWISWALNPTGTGMAGSQALIAFRDANGQMTVKTYNISSYAPVKESKVWYEVKESSAEFSGGVMRLFATLVLPDNNKTTLNHVWQVGSSVTGGVPNRHGFQAANLAAKGSLDLLKGKSTTAVVGAGDDSKTKERNVHGILNVVSWGILFPIGVIIARYMKTFPSADRIWFYLHVICQLSGYAIGVAGWATGMILGSQSKGVTYSAHRNIGITLFSLATVQILALFLRPKKDHKYRIYWNVYHHSFGYTILVLGIVNVFKGLDILNPDAKWNHAYIALISVLGCIALFLEATTWIIVTRRNKKLSNSSTKPPLDP